MSREFIANIMVLEEELSKMLDDLSIDKPSDASDFFARFGFADLYNGNRFYETLELGHKILHLCEKLNPQKTEIIHKGYPLYWMGMAAFRMYDFQSAIYYMDATLSEDQKNFPSNHNSPPRLFLRLEGDRDEQAAKNLVKGAQNTLEEFLTIYNNSIELNKLSIRPLSIEEIRSSFLSPAVDSQNPDIRSLASTFITFFLEFKYRDFQLNLRKQPGTNEPFFIHLFKGCLLFESLLKYNPKKDVTTRNDLYKILKELAKELNLPEKFKIGGEKLPNILSNVKDLDDQFTTAVITTCKLRNTLGHNLGWNTQISRTQYLNCFLLIETSCLHSISILYRSIDN